MRILIIILTVVFLSCNGDHSDQVVSTQGTFEFPEEISLGGTEALPDYLDPTKILCYGRGIRVARCISAQLKTGICLGILKEGKEVYVVEIDCHNVKESPVEELLED